MDDPNAQPETRATPVEPGPVLFSIYEVRRLIDKTDLTTFRTAPDTYVPRHTMREDNNPATWTRFRVTEYDLNGGLTGRWAYSARSNFGTTIVSHKWSRSDD